MISQHLPAAGSLDDVRYRVAVRALCVRLRMRQAIDTRERERQRSKEQRDGRREELTERRWETFNLRTK